MVAFVFTCAGWTYGGEFLHSFVAAWSLLVDQCREKLNSKNNPIENISLPSSLHFLLAWLCVSQRANKSSNKAC
jgi:hypothetical protein